MMLDKIKVAIFVFIHVFGTLTLHALDITDIKDTYSFLKPEYRHCSPLHGAIWWETDLVKKYYFFGSLEEKRDKKGKRIPLKIDSLYLGNAMEGDETINLIHQLFHVVQGSFSTTNNASYPAYHFSAVTIGKIIGTCEQISADQKIEEIEKALKEHISTDTDFINSRAETERIQKEIASKLNNKNQEEKKTEKEIKDFLTTIDEITKLFKSKNIELKQNTPENYNSGIKQLLAQNKEIESDKNIDANIEQFNKEIKVLEEEKEKDFKDYKAPKKKQNLSDEKQKKITKFTQLTTHIKNKKDLLKTLNLIKNYQDTLILNQEKYTHYLEIKKDIEKLEKNLADNDVKKIDARLPLFISTLVGSLKECGLIKTDKEPFYLPYTPYAILLAFLYRKAKTKQELIDYISTLKNTLNTDIYEKPLTAEVYPKILEAKNLIETKQELITKQKTDKDIKDAIEKFLDFKPDQKISYESLVYTEIMLYKYQQSLPPKAEYRDSLFRKNKFPDCMDTTMRNICNIIMYDGKTKTFTRTFNPKDAIKLSEKLAAFYQKYKEPSTISNQDTHNAWTEVIENLPFTAYLNHVKKGEVILGREPQYAGEFGYVHDFKIPEDVKNIQIKEVKNQNFKFVTHEEKSYRFIDSKEYELFELLPSLKNIIIILNQLFGLNLYEKPLEEEFWFPDFNKKYFKKLCEKFSWKASEIDEEKLDKKDYQFSQNITLSTNGGRFIIELSRQHGNLQIIQSQSYNDDSSYHFNEYINSLLAIFNLSEKQTLQKFFNLLSLGILYSYQTNNSYYSSGKKSIFEFHSYFFPNLFNEIRRMTCLIGSTEYFNSENHVFLKFVAKLILSFPIRSDLYYQASIFENKNILKKYKESSIIRTAIHDLIRKLEFIPSNTTPSTLSFLRELVIINDPKCPFTQCITAAQAGAKKEEASLEAFKLFNELIERGYGLQESYESIKTFDYKKLFKLKYNPKSGGDDYVILENNPVSAIARILKHYPNKLEETLETIEKQSPYHESKFILIYVKLKFMLIKELIEDENKKSYPLALKLSKDVLQQSDFTKVSWDLALEILRKLVQKKYYSEDIIDIFTPMNLAKIGNYVNYNSKGYTGPYAKYVTIPFSILQAFIIENIALEKILNLTFTLHFDKSFKFNFKFSQEILSLFEKLFEKKIDLQKVANKIFSNIEKNIDEFSLYSFIDLFKLLIKHGYGFKEIYTLACKFKDKNPTISLELYSLLVERDKYILEAFEAAKQNIQHQQAVNIIRNLIEKEECISDIMTLIKKIDEVKVPNDEQQSLKINQIWLLTDLAKKGFYLKEIVAFLQERLVTLLEIGNYNFNDLLLNCITTLIKQREGFEEALYITTNLIKKSVCAYKGTELFETLLQNGYDLKAAQEYVTSTFPDNKKIQEELFALIKKYEEEGEIPKKLRLLQTKLQELKNRIESLCISLSKTVNKLTSLQENLSLLKQTS